MSETENPRMAFGRQVVAYAADGRRFQRYDAVYFLPKESEMLGWSGQKELAEEWLDVLVGAGVLEKRGHVYTLVRWEGQS